LDDKLSDYIHLEKCFTSDPKNEILPNLEMNDVYEEGIGSQDCVDDIIEAEIQVYK
jgi:hypothetical protein